MLQQHPSRCARQLDSSLYLPEGGARLAPRFEVINGSIDAKVRLTARDSIDGVQVYSAQVEDEYTPTTEQARQIRASIQGTIMGLEQSLRSGDVAIATEAAKEGQELLDSSPTIRAWKELMTTAMALYPLQRPMASHMLDGTPVDAFARDLFLHGQDAIGIRDRGAIFSHLVAERDGRVRRIISLGGGAAVPECDVIKMMAEKPESVVVVDMDEKALKHVGDVALEAGLQDVNFELVSANLIKDFMLASEQHEAMPKEHFDVVDLLGITEYFKDRHAKALLEKAYQLVKPGGALIFGNMLDTHPTLQFNQQIVEWPGVIPRSRELLAEISTQIAGHENVEMYIPESGVYAVLKLEKPTDSNHFVRPLGVTALVR